MALRVLCAFGPGVESGGESRSAQSRQEPAQTPAHPRRLDPRREALHDDTSRPPTRRDHHLAPVHLPGGRDETPAAHSASRRVPRPHRRRLIAPHRPIVHRARPLAKAPRLDRARVLHANRVRQHLKVKAAFVPNRRGPSSESPSELRESAPPRRDVREAFRLAPVTERVEPRDKCDAEVDGEHAVHEPLAPAKHRPRRVSSLADGAPPRQSLRTSKVSQPPRDATRPTAALRRVRPRDPRGVEFDVSDPRERFPESHPSRAALAYVSRPRVKKIRGVRVQPSRQQPMRRLPLGRSAPHRVRPPVERGRDG